MESWAAVHHHDFHWRLPRSGPLRVPGSHGHWHTVESSRSSGGLTPFTVPVTTTDLYSDSDSYEICGVTQAASESTWLDTDTSRASESACQWARGAIRVESETRASTRRVKPARVSL